MKTQQRLMVRTKSPPVVEVDSSAAAAYIRFSREPVERTQEVTQDGPVVTVDFNKAGEVVGVELVGVREFTLKPLLKMTPLRHIPDRVSSRARYVSTELQPA